MTDELLPYYHEELRALHTAAAEFAELYPAVAGRLQLTGDSEDPHVKRLLQGVAFLNARVRRKLDDDFPELTNALLGVLYPHYLAPIPSMAIVQLQGQPDLVKPFTVSAGTELETKAVAGESYGYRTSAPVTLWPVSLSGASLTGRPITAPKNLGASGAAAVLRLTLKCYAPDQGFARLGLDTLRFYLSGPTRDALSTYETLFRSVISVALADSPNDDKPVLLGPDCIRPVGFGRNEGILPYQASSFPGYRLLTEYFTFPQKFLFFDLTGLSSKQRFTRFDHLDVYIYLSESMPELERTLSASSFALGCTPIVNLFRQQAEPIDLDETTTAYRIVPDSRRPDAHEVYAVEAVEATDGKGQRMTYQAFYSVRDSGSTAATKLYWHTERHPRQTKGGGTDIRISLVDPNFDPRAPADQVLSVDLTCLNPNLPQGLLLGGGKYPELTLIEGSSQIDRIAWMTPSTRTLRLPEQGRWRLVSHLLLNHLSLSDLEQGPEALREILRLYDFRDEAETRARIESILSVRCRRGAARAPGPDMGVLCRGIDVEIEFDAQRFSDQGLYLFAAVLERFLALYGSINSFTRLTATIRGRSGVFKQWPARAGETVLL